MAKCVLGYWAANKRLLLVKLQGQPFNISLLIITYAPTTESSEDEIEEFYEQLQKVKDQCKTNEIAIVLGDLNAKVGWARDGITVGPFGIGERNERGDRWVQWCETNNMVITNTWFKHHARRTYTWKSPGDQCRNQIDYITINNRFKRAITSTKSYPGADCGSDHNPVISPLHCKLKKIRKNTTNSKLDFERLYKPEIRRYFTIEVMNKFKSIEDEGTELTWELLKDTLVEAAETKIPKKENQTKQKSMTKKF